MTKLKDLEFYSEERYKRSDNRRGRRYRLRSFRIDTKVKGADDPYYVDIRVHLGDSRFSDYEYIEDGEITVFSLADGGYHAVEFELFPFIKFIKENLPKLWERLLNDS